MNEEWRGAPGFEGSYEVSDHGRVRGLDRNVERRNGTRMFVAGRVLAPVRSGTGKYLTVSLKVGGRNVSTYIHRLVAEAFLGPCPSGMECCHGNGNGHDNRLANLRWDTRFANAQDKFLHGTNAQVNKTHCPQKHPYSAENTYIWTDPQTGGRARMCRTCRRARRLRAA